MHKKYHGSAVWGFQCVALLLICHLGGCGESEQAAWSASAGRDLPAQHASDPAMNPAPETGPVPAEAVRIDVLPDELSFDAEAQRIFVPEMGWMPIAEFWQIYETNPARLPPDMDYKAVHQLKLSLADQDDDEA